MRPRSGLPAARRSSVRSRPWSAELRTMWVSGSLIRSSTWRSSSVSAPCISRSICLPSSAPRSRTMRGSFCQALPIGCIRVFITPSCSSAVTLDSRCSGPLNSESSWRRTISRSWLRVSTSSETMVISCSSESTSDADRLVGDPCCLLLRCGFRGRRFGGLCGRRGARRSVWRNARSRSSSESSPGRSGRSSTCVTSVPTVCVCAAAPADAVDHALEIGDQILVGAVGLALLVSPAPRECP